VLVVYQQLHQNQTVAQLLMVHLPHKVVLAVAIAVPQQEWQEQTVLEQVPLEQARVLLEQQLLEPFLATTTAVEVEQQQFLLELQVTEKQERQEVVAGQLPQPHLPH
jgi:hypothetical protein